MANTTDTLKDLLFDMGQFLRDTLVGETLSSNAEKQRERLLQRLQPHIRGQSAPEMTSAPTTPPPYLDMNGPKGVREEYVNAEVNADKVEEEYEEFPELAPPPIPAKVPIDNVPTFKIDSSNSGQSEDYANLSLPYSELRTMTQKCGPLWRKEKFIFLDQWRQYWAGVYGHVVLIYNSERDTKPSSSMDVQGFEARPVTANNHKDPKKKDAFFEIVCPGKKTHQFIARTAKDMTQWVTAICMASRQPTPTVPHHVFLENSKGGRRKLPSLPTDSESEAYDDIASPKYENEDQNYEPVQSEEEEIYHDIAEVYQGSSFHSKHDSEVNTSDEQPPIPPRHPVSSISQDSLSDHDSVYDDVAVAGSIASNTYSNTADCSDEAMQERESPQQSIKHEEEKVVETKEEEEIEDEEEAIYDDIGIIEKPPEKTLPAFRRESSGGNGRIQNIIKKMEASLSNGNKTVAGYQSKSKTVKQRTQSEELYEPIESDGIEINPAVPQLPPRSHVVH